MTLKLCMCSSWQLSVVLLYKRTKPEHDLSWDWMRNLIAESCVTWLILGACIHKSPYLPSVTCFYGYCYRRKLSHERDRKRHARTHIHILWLLSDLRILRQCWCRCFMYFFINNLPLNKLQVLYITGYKPKVIWRRHICNCWLAGEIWHEGGT